VPPAAPQRHHSVRQRLATTLVDAVIALAAGIVVGLAAHRLAGDEPLATDPEYAGHLFTEAVIVVLAALIAYWLISDIRAARRRNTP
jgi:Na+/H+-dicarboxylate symporter